MLSSFLSLNQNIHTGLVPSVCDCKLNLLPSVLCNCYGKATFSSYFIASTQFPFYFTDPEIGLSASSYRVAEGAGSVNVVVTATTPGLSGYVTLQTENGNATGEQLNKRIVF